MPDSSFRRRIYAVRISGAVMLRAKKEQRYAVDEYNDKEEFIRTVGAGLDFSTAHAFSIALQGAVDAFIEDNLRENPIHD